MERERIKNKKDRERERNLKPDNHTQIPPPSGPNLAPSPFPRSENRLYRIFQRILGSALRLVDTLDSVAVFPADKEEDGARDSLLFVTCREGWKGNEEEDGGERGKGGREGEGKDDK